MIAMVAFSTIRLDKAYLAKANKIYVLAMSLCLWPASAHNANILDF